MTQALNRIIYVDDEPHIRLVAQLALEKVGGFATYVCGSGRCLLENGPSFAPDLILLDVMMPEMDGPATLVAARRLPALRDVPVMFVTAKTQGDEVDRFRSLGCMDVIPKPFRPLEFARHVREIWEKGHGGAANGDWQRTLSQPPELFYR